MEPVAEPTAFVSGTRLQARTANGLFTRWHDTELDLDCSFARTVSGEWRCLPTAGIIRLFDNPMCAPAEAGAALGGCRASYASYSVARESSCGTVFPWDHAVGAVAIRPVELVDESGAPLWFNYTLDSNGVCRPEPDGLPAECLFEEVSTDLFVRGELTYERVGALDRVSVAAEDGAVQLLGVQLHDGAAPLELQYGALIPAGRSAQFSSSEPAFADADCTAPAACVDTADCEADFAVAYDDCSARVYAVGEAVDSVRRGTSCDPDAGSGSCFTLGPEIGPFPVTYESEGEGRLQIRWMAAAGARLMPVGYYDREFDAPCIRLPYVDRCGPSTWEFELERAFSDAACTVPIGYLRPDGACGDAPRMVALGPGGPDAPAAYRLNPIEPEGAVYSQNGCVRVGSGRQLYEAVPVTLEELPELEPN